MRSLWSHAEIRMIVGQAVAAERKRCAEIVRKHMPLSHTKAAILLEIEGPEIEEANDD